MYEFLILITDSCTCTCLYIILLYYSEPDLEEFLNNLYSQSGSNMGTSGGNDSNAARQRRKGKRKK